MNTLNSLLEFTSDFNQWFWLAVALTVFAIGVALYVYKGALLRRAGARKKIADENLAIVATERRRNARKAAAREAARKDAEASTEAERLDIERTERLAAQADRVATAERERQARATAAFDAAAASAKEQRKRFHDARDAAVRRAQAGNRHDQANTGPSAEPVPERPVIIVEPVAPAKMPSQTLVLVADDSKVVRFKTGRLLGEHHYKVMFATDGLDAVAQMRAHKPDIVVTDVEMPGMDGFQLARYIRRDANLSATPIIMITAAEDRHKSDAASAGVSVLLGKPYADEDLMVFIRSAMLPVA